MAKDKAKKAVALKYKFGQAMAPKVVAKGRGTLAEKIIELARKHGVHIYPDPDLTEALYKLDLLEEIPPRLYQAVAEVLAFVYVISKKWEAIKKEKEDGK
ncbi:MAG: EscU/YscU/HrcU family type III secretion system export apparatus switch protein [Candidatus Desulfofervidaceae bacterium]|nr:EscU/YscU/HrcU family type III secretion system export apparatus switch protein [Candidatus Desulfofervidaceae bacterium]